MQISQKKNSQDPSFDEKKKQYVVLKIILTFFSTEKIAKIIQTFQSKSLSMQKNYNSCLKLLETILIFIEKKIYNFFMFSRYT